MATDIRRALMDGATNDQGRMEVDVKLATFATPGGRGRGGNENKHSTDVESTSGVRDVESTCRVRAHLRAGSPAEAQSWSNLG
jgi:hypothetical protein